MAIDLERVSGYTCFTTLGCYLGVPLLHSQQREDTYAYLIDKVRKRLSTWKSKQLAFAGRVTLVQLVLPAIPSYTMQTVLLPKSVCDKIEQLMRNFIWGATDQQRKWHTVSWEAMCRPKDQGGLGLRRVHLFNKALLMRLAWNMMANPIALWVQVIRHKYGCGSEGWPTVRKRGSCSNTWRGITHVWDATLKGTQWGIGNGFQINFWTDIWLPSGVILQDVALRELTAEEMGMTVAQMTDGEGNWQLHSVAHLFPLDILDQIRGV